MVLDFCKKIAETRHTNDKDAHEKLKDFNYDFLKENQSILIDLLRVSCIGTASLLDLTSEAVFDIINGKTAEEIHKMFNMKQDFNAKDMEMLLELDDWGFE
ncbi:SKP1-like 11 [Artemisia annua]|uniref:SKP1-like 11 n=1 Tax=Artemisia annua TaxID=35608 RepID=A0A2U1N059_ARTAN|nr:SKP1-like 11 [Artemisia annua]